MDTYKIERANKLYSKIQGLMWAKEKNEEYDHYERAEECGKEISKCWKEMKELKLTNKERQETGFDHYDYDLAVKYYYGFR